MLSELESVKEAVRTLSIRVAAIDKHLRRVYQLPKASRPLRRATEPSADREAILRRFDQLRALYVNAGAAAADDQLNALGDNDLRDLVRELGLPNSRKASARRLRDFVAQRLRESSLLGTGSVLRGPEETDKAEATDPHSGENTGSFCGGV